MVSKMRSSKSAKNQGIKGIKIAKLENKTNDIIKDLVYDTLKRGKQILIFVSTRRYSESLAESLSKDKVIIEEIIRDNNQNIRDKIANDVLSVLSTPTKQCKKLANCLLKGIAFHHAGLIHQQKEIIETYFRSGIIKVICCTPTLSMGINVPAFRVIIRDVKRFSESSFFVGQRYIPVLEYEQMSGRCGRPGYDKYGESILIAKTKEEIKKLKDTYINGEIEPIFSKLAVEPILRMHVLSSIASGFVNYKDDIKHLFSKTFYAHQYKDLKKLNRIVDSILHSLLSWGMIRENKLSVTKDSKHKNIQNIANEEYFTDALSLSNNIKTGIMKGHNKDVYIEATLVGKRISQLYIDPLTGYNLISGINKAKRMISSGDRISDFSILQLICFTLEMRPLLRVKKREEEVIYERSLQLCDELLCEEPSMYDTYYTYYINSLKTALMFYDWINEKDEEYLYERYDITPGELYNKINIADWLLYACSEISRLLGFFDIIKLFERLRARVVYGVKDELLPLIRIKGIGRKRARKLYNVGIKNLRDLKRADVSLLYNIIGKKITIEVLKRFINGQEIKDIKEHNINLNNKKRDKRMSRSESQTKIEDF